MLASEAGKHPFSERFYGSLVFVMFHSNLDVHNKDMRGGGEALMCENSGSGEISCI